jgi:uncharacterized membrane protein YkgB
MQGGKGMFQNNLKQATVSVCLLEEAAVIAVHGKMYISGVVRIVLWEKQMMLGSLVLGTSGVCSALICCCSVCCSN